MAHSYSDDSYLTLSTTAAGRNLIVRSLYGESITFTRIAIGNGVPADPDSVSDMANELLSISLTAAEPSSDFMLLTGYVSSSQIEASFYGYEIGVYAKDSNNVEYLFAYRYSTSDVDFYPAAGSGRALELNLSVVVQLGNAENVTAILVEGDTYAPKADFDAHVADESNPHSVTKSQVGLGNVPNVTTNDQTPTYTVASVLAGLVSGETLSVALGKIARAIISLSSHVNNKSNPHGVTAAQVGAAASSHNHSAADINSGTFGVARGGTGKSSVTSGAILKGNGTSALAEISGTGALYATTKNSPAFGTLPISCGGTGMTEAPSMLTNLASTTPASPLAANPRPGVTGVLPVANGGTGVSALDGTDYSTAKPRKIYAGTGAMTSGSSSLANGVIYLQYV